MTTPEILTFMTEEREKRYAQIRAIVAKAGSRIFSVTFIKKDGSERTMQVQMMAMKTHVVGEAASESAKKGVQTRAENNPNLLNVWDIGSHGFRSVNMDTVKAVTLDHVTYLIE